MAAIITSPGPSPAILSSQILGTASVEENVQSKPKFSFSFTPFLLKTYRHGISPSQPVCKAYMQGLCPLGNACPDRHIANNRRGGFGGGFGRFGDEISDLGGNLVCKHWLRGLCKKGEGCEFLHEYNLRKMPECTTFTRSGYCPNGDECLYLHIDAYTKESLLPCPHYARGFCPLGPACAKSHRRKQICPFYLAGFCPQGITNPPPPLPAGVGGSREKVFEGFGGCEYGIHAKWLKESDLPPLKRKVVRTKEEIEEERERKREEAEEREAAEGGGFRVRGGYFNGFRGGRGGRGGFESGGFRGRGRGRY